MKRNFLVVAANSQVRETLAQDLDSQGYSVTRAAGGIEAQRAVDSVEFDAIVIESHLPDMSAEELHSRLTAGRPDRPVIVLSSFDLVRNTPEHLHLGTADYVVRPDQVVGLLKACDEARTGGAGGGSQHSTDALVEIVDVLVGLIELDDKFFGGSSHKVMKLVRATAQELSMDADGLQEVSVATLLRDIGKVGVDDSLGLASGTYTKKQKNQMREHVTASLRLFEHIDMPWKILPIIRHHHERYDGTGHPDGLRGREIPLGARIVSVVDAYVAMTSHRQHRKALAPEEALQELIVQTGRQFDPEIIEAFQKVLDKQLEGRMAKVKPRILISDPQEDFRRLLKMRFLNEGFEVLETVSPEAALGELLKEAPDMVLVDIDADDTESFHLYQEIREDEALSRIPFAFLSKKMDRVLKLRALRQGVDDYLNKGDDLEEIVARVENILTREALRREQGGRRTRRGITGDLENLSLPDIVQTLAMGMKTACLTIQTGDDNGKIWFVNGATSHAEAGDLQGDDAFYEMVRWTAGEFVIEHGVKTDEETVNKDSMYLLMEGLRLLDEAAQDASQAAS